MQKKIDKKHKDLINFVLITVLTLLMCDITDVIHYYTNKSEYVEYEAIITDFEENGRRHKRDYYCTVEYYDENGKVCTEDFIHREFGDKEGKAITFYMTDDGRIYRKGYVKYMSHMYTAIIYEMYLILMVRKLIIKFWGRRQGEVVSEKSIHNN